jgi:hypothetical protein
MSPYDTYIRRLNRQFRDYVESDSDSFAGLLDTDESTIRHAPYSRRPILWLLNKIDF